MTSRTVRLPQLTTWWGMFVFRGARLNNAIVSFFGGRGKETGFPASGRTLHWSRSAALRGYRMGVASPLARRSLRKNVISHSSRGCNRLRGGFPGICRKRKAADIHCQRRWFSLTFAGRPIVLGEHGGGKKARKRNHAKARPQRDNLTVMDSDHG